LRTLGWQPKIPLREGIARTYAWFLQNVDAVKRDVAHAEVSPA